MSHGPRAPARRAGFTLVELMVGLSLGAVVIMSVYTIGVASARHFQEQQRISQLQLATRLAIDRLRRDVSLAGFGGTPDSDAERSVGGGTTSRIVGVSLVDHAPGGMSVLSGLEGASEAGVEADALRLVGNFETSDVYLVRDYDGGNTINLQTNWQGFRRSFMATPDGTMIDTTLFEQVFSAGRVVHVVHPTAGHHFAVISSASADPGGSSARIDLNGGLPASVDVCLGCLVAPVMGVEYSIADATGPMVARDAIVTGPNTVLVRQEFDLTTGALVAGTQRTILEWAIDFDVDAFVDTSPVGTGAAPMVTFMNDALAQANVTASPASVRSLVVSVSARTPAQDDRFPWVARAVGAPLTRFRAFTGRDGASRVRTSRAELFLPSIAYRGLR